MPDMPRYKVEEKTVCTEKFSVISFIFPILSVLYAEGIFAYFTDSGLNTYKILFALAAGCITAALSRLTPMRILNYILQTVWVLFCVGLITVQFLCVQTSGTYFSLFEEGNGLPTFSSLLTAAVKNLPFLICMAVPVVLQFTVQCVALLRRRSLLGALLGADWMELLGMLLLASILSFVSVTLALYADTGDTSPRRQIETEYMPEVSVETFGVLPQTVLDVKFNVLEIAEEEVIRHYIVTEDGQQIELTDEEFAAWQREG